MLAVAQPIDVAGTPIARERLEHTQRTIATFDGRPRRWPRASYRREVTRILTVQLWLAKEARAQGVLVTRAEADRRLRLEARMAFGGEAAFRRFLRRSGQTRIEGYAREFEARWQQRTTCSPRYHVAKSCRPLTRPARGR